MSDIERDWWIFEGTGVPPKELKAIPKAPPWRQFGDVERARFLMDPPEIDLVNAALLLRRPLLITGIPGIGKSSLIHAVARELGLGEVLLWPINTRSKLQNGLFDYDAIGRLQEEERAKKSPATAEKPSRASKEDEAWEHLGKYVKLGPLGEAFLPSDRPRALLIDEIDKSDIDLPNDLLNIFEEGTFEIPVLSRAPWRSVRVQPWSKSGERVEIKEGRVTAKEFPFVVLTSNGERDFPQAFLRRCIRLKMEKPDETKLGNIVAAHLRREASKQGDALIKEFLGLNVKDDLATDQLLNAVFLTTQRKLEFGSNAPPALKDALLKPMK